jgi:hypothetical protein
MSRSTTDRLLSLLLDVGESSRNVKLKLEAAKMVIALREKRPRKGPKPAPKPLTEAERLLGIEQKD